MPCIDIANENLSSVDTRQSSRTFRARNSAKKLNSSQVTRSSMVMTSQIMSSYMDQSRAVKRQASSQEQIPVLDRII